MYASKRIQIMPKPKPFISGEEAYHTELKVEEIILVTFDYEQVEKRVNGFIKEFNWFMDEHNKEFKAIIMTPNFYEEYLLFGYDQYGAQIMLPPDNFGGVPIYVMPYEFTTCGFQLVKDNIKTLYECKKNER